WQRGLVSGSEGNISVKLPDGRLLVTPSGVSKGFMEPGQVVLCDKSGRPLEGSNPTSELPLHLEVYRRRPDVGAVVHAHPPCATAFAAARMDLESCFLPEAVVLLGRVSCAEYATPWTDELAASIRPYVERSDAVLLANHGAVTWADSLELAWQKMETLEATARIELCGRMLGGVRQLESERIDRLTDLRRQKGISGRVAACRPAGNAVRMESDKASSLVDLVAAQVVAALTGENPSSERQER
ncbi:MAG: class II aldolase/adducin family protein, partial [Deltaproteobacteria bacterium]